MQSILVLGTQNQKRALYLGTVTRIKDASAFSLFVSAAVFLLPHERYILRKSIVEVLYLLTASDTYQDRSQNTEPDKGNLPGNGDQDQRCQCLQPVRLRCCLCPPA